MTTTSDPRPPQGSRPPEAETHGFNWGGYLRNALMVAAAAIIVQFLFSHRSITRLQMFVFLPAAVLLALVVMAIPYTWDWLKRTGGHH